MTIPFYKLSATGNDFVVIDHRKPFLRPDRFVEFVTTVCTPHTGVGADGILLLEASAGATWQMVYYNADGSRGEMCGNGARAGTVRSVSTSLGTTRHLYCGRRHSRNSERRQSPWRDAQRQPGVFLCHAVR